MNKTFLFWAICTAICCNSMDVNMFYCGFSGDYCGQSRGDDVYSGASMVILAFANTDPSGGVYMDEDNFPATEVSAWKKAGKKVLLSVGGQNGNWAYVFATEQSRAKFIETLTNYVIRFKLDGVDLDIESYLAPPRVVADTIIDLKKALSTKGRKLLVVSPECVAIYQGAPVPSPDAAGQPFNYFVPIIALADSSIDFYQVQAYNNWYDGFAGGSLQYIQDVMLNWMNLQGLSPYTKPLDNFAGVSGKKLIIGMLASTSAGNPSYYAQPDTIRQFKSWAHDQKHDFKGFMIWDTHWDANNAYTISKVCAE